MKTQSTTKGFAILSAAAMLVKIISVLYVPFLLAIIGNYGWGIYYGAYQIFLLLYIITNSGIPSAVSKQVSELIAIGNYKDALKTFKIARLILMIFGFFMAILMLIMAKPLAGFIHLNQAYLAIMALSPTVFFSAIESAYRGYFQGRGDMKPTAISQVLEQIINTVFSLLFAALWLKYGIEAACAGGTVGTTLGAIVSAAYLIWFYKRNKDHRVLHRNDGIVVVRLTNKQLVKRLLYFGVPITLCWGLQYAGNIVDASNTVGRLAKAGLPAMQAAIQYGNYGKFQTLINVPITIISALCAAVLPLISAAAARKSKSDVKHGIDFALKTCYLIAIPSAVGLAVLSTPIFTIFGSRFAGGAPLMEIGSIILIMMAVVQIQTTILQGIGKIYQATAYLILGLIVKIAANYFLIAMPAINIKGAIIGTVLGYLLPLLLNRRLIMKSMRVPFSIIVPSLKPLMASIIMGLWSYFVYNILYLILSFVSSGYVTNFISVTVAISSAAFVYLYILILNKGITKSDMESLPKKLAKFIPEFMMRKMY
jgi:stage V sporulation protein B